AGEPATRARRRDRRAARACAGAAVRERSRPRPALEPVRVGRACERRVGPREEPTVLVEGSVGIGWIRDALEPHRLATAGGGEGGGGDEGPRAGARGPRGC